MGLHIPGVRTRRNFPPIRHFSFRTSSGKPKISSTNPQPAFARIYVMVPSAVPWMACLFDVYVYETTVVLALVKMLTVCYVFRKIEKSASYSPSSIVSLYHAAHKMLLIYHSLQSCSQTRRSVDCSFARLLACSVGCLVVRSFHFSFIINHTTYSSRTVCSGAAL